MSYTVFFGHALYKIEDKFQCGLTYIVLCLSGKNIIVNVVEILEFICLLLTYQYFQNSQKFREILFIVVVSKKIQHFDMDFEMKKNFWKNRFDSTREIYAFILWRKKLPRFSKVRYINFFFYFFAIIPAFMISLFHLFCQWF